MADMPADYRSIVFLPETLLYGKSEEGEMGKKQCSMLVTLSFAIFLLLITLFACNIQDSDYIPIGLKAMDVWVWDDATNRNYYGGRIKATYFSKDSALSECASRAYALANQYNLHEWSYVCCTVTYSSDCVTKVR